jgi:hypothetical protein
MAADRPICHIWNHLHLVFQLELEQVGTSPSQGVEVAQGTADGTTSAALNLSSFRRVRRIQYLDRQAATFFANYLERRSFAGGVFAHHVRARQHAITDVR